MIRSAWIIARKDLTQRIRDRSALIIAVIVPFGLAFILSATLGGVADQSITFEFAVADADGGEVAGAFTDVLDEVVAAGFVDVTAVESRAEVLELVDGDAVSAGFAIPAGFSAAVTSGQPAALTVVVNPEAPIGSQVARSLADGFAAEVNAVQLAVATVLAGEGAAPEPARIGELQQAAIATETPVTLNDVATDDRGIDFTTFYAAGIAVFFVFFTVQFGILSLINERQEGTMARLIAAPIRPAAIILGKVLGAFVLGVVAMLLLVVATTLLMGATWGDPLGVVAMVIAGVVAAMGVTALTATFARTAEGASGISTMVVVVMGILGGTFFPVSQAASALASLSLLTPHRWMMDGFSDLASGDGLADILVPVAAVLAFGIATGAVGLLRARRLVVGR